MKDKKFAKLIFFGCALTIFLAPLMMSGRDFVHICGAKMKRE